MATFLGTMGLPHVLVRFTPTPDGRSARRTALTVIALLSLFYLFPLVRGVRPAIRTRTAHHRKRRRRGAADAGGGDRRHRRTVARGAGGGGAVAAFLATSSGLLVSVAGALSTDVLRGRVRDFRLAASSAGRSDRVVAGGGIVGTVATVGLCVRGVGVDAVPAAGPGHLVAWLTAPARSPGCWSAGVVGVGYESGDRTCGARRCARRLAGDHRRLSGGGHRPLDS